MNEKKPNKRVIIVRPMNEKKPNKRKAASELFVGKDLSNKRYILEKDLRLKEKAKVLNDSVGWWEERMNESFNKLDAWEKKEKEENSYSLSFDPFETEEELEEELQEIIREIEFLSNRGQIEAKASKELEREINEFLKECKGLI